MNLTTSIDRSEPQNNNFGGNQENNFESNQENNFEAESENNSILFFYLANLFVTLTVWIILLPLLPIKLRAYMANFSYVVIMIILGMLCLSFVLLLICLVFKFLMLLFESVRKII